MENNNNKAKYSGTNGRAIVNSGTMVKIGGYNNAVKKDGAPDGKNPEEKAKEKGGKGEEKKDEKKGKKAEKIEAKKEEKKESSESSLPKCESAEAARLISVFVNEIYLPDLHSSVTFEMFSNTDEKIKWHARRTSDSIKVRPSEGMLDPFDSVEITVSRRGPLTAAYHRITLNSVLTKNCEDMPMETLVLPVVSKKDGKKDGKKKKAEEKMEAKKNN